MKKYFDQTFKTRFSKQTMAKLKGFQWVINEMENEFEYPQKDIRTVDEFFSILARYRLHIEYFIRLYEIDKTNLEINNKFIKLLSNIAKFTMREENLNNVIKDNDYKNFSSLYLLGIIAGFVQKTSGAYDFGMFIYYNWFELYEIKSMSIKNKNSIEKLLNELSIKEKDKIIDIFLKNYNEVKVKYNTKNLINLNKYNKLFGNIGYKRNQFCTWQEDYILKMSDLGFSISEIVPFGSSRAWKIPNYDLWNESIISNMKNFFKECKDALIILEIIDCRLNNNKISSETQIIVFNQILKIIKERNIYYDFDNIWFYLLIKFQQSKEEDNYIRKNINQVYIALKKKRNIQIIIFLKENGFKIDKELQSKINKYYIKQIKTIEKIEDLTTFNELLEDEYIKKNVNIEIISNIMKVFYKLVNKSEENLQSANSFYHLMNFLIAIKINVNNEIVNNYIFDILKLWNENYFEKETARLKKFEYKTSIENKKIKAYNKVFIENPLLCLKIRFSWSEQEILREMTESSNAPIATMFKSNTIYIDDFFPYMKKIDLNSKDSFDIIMCKYIDNIQIKYEEQLLNSNLEPVAYLQSIYESYSFKLMSFIFMIDEENYKEMYEAIKASFLKYTLLPYPPKIEMAHITQLIPLVEILIRDLGIKNNIIPFKEKEYQIHVMKDSSTVLLNIIRQRYKKNNNFENMEIYLYLYNYLYNSNSLNIRNELIHARNYLDKESDMNFVFKVLVVGIFWGTIELFNE